MTPEDIEEKEQEELLNKHRKRARFYDFMAKFVQWLPLAIFIFFISLSNGTEDILKTGFTGVISMIWLHMMNTESEIKRLPFHFVMEILDMAILHMSKSIERDKRKKEEDGEMPVEVPLDGEA